MHQINSIAGAWTQLRHCWWAPTAWTRPDCWVVHLLTNPHLSQTPNTCSAAAAAVLAAGAGAAAAVVAADGSLQALTARSQLVQGILVSLPAAAAADASEGRTDSKQARLMWVGPWGHCLMWFRFGDFAAWLLQHVMSCHVVTP